MIVPTSAKVGIARFYFAALLPNPADSTESRGVFELLFNAAAAFLQIFLEICAQSLPPNRTLLIEIQLSMIRPSFDVQSR